MARAPTDFVEKGICQFAIDYDSETLRMVQAARAQAGDDAAKFVLDQRTEYRRGAIHAVRKLALVMLETEYPADDPPRLH